MNQPHQAGHRARERETPDGVGASSAELARTKRTVLFAFSGAPRASDGLQRACDLARAMDTELHVLQVLPARSPIDPLSPLLELIDARRLERRRTARDRFAAGPELSGACERRGRVQVRTGLFVKHVADHAAALHPALIMVPPRKHGLGSIVTTLTRTANVPVLVLRESRSERAIVAATDLEDAEYSVLRAAAELGNQLHWRVIPFHNVTPISMPVSVETLSPITILTGSAEAENRQIRLARASRQLQIDAPAVTASEVNPVDAILRIAQTKDAGMVVVGARPRSWFGHLIARGVAAQVVNCAQRSVLVTPLATPRSAPAAPLAEC